MTECPSPDIRLNTEITAETLLVSSDSSDNDSMLMIAATTLGERSLAAQIWERKVRISTNLTPTTGEGITVYSPWTPDKVAISLCWFFAISETRALLVIPLVTYSSGPQYSHISIQEYYLIGEDDYDGEYVGELDSKPRLTVSTGITGFWPGATNTTAPEQIGGSGNIHRQKQNPAVSLDGWWALQWLDKDLSGTAHRMSFFIEEDNLSNVNFEYEPIAAIGAEVKQALIGYHWVESPVIES